MTDSPARGGARSKKHERSGVWEEAKSETRLDRAEVVRIALELLERQGFDGFSMRGLASALNIKSPSLYWYVRSRDELFDLVIDAVLAECQLSEDHDMPWADALSTVAKEVRRVLLAHPAATRLLTGRVPLVPNWLRIAEHVIGTLRQAGFADQTANYCYLVLLYYAIGFVTQEIAFGTGPDARQRLADMHNFVLDLPVDRYPNLIAVTDAFGDRGLGDRFDLGLHGIILGIAERRGS